MTILASRVEYMSLRWHLTALTPLVEGLKLAGLLVWTFSLFTNSCKNYKWKHSVSDGAVTPLQTNTTQVLPDPVGPTKLSVPSALLLSKSPLKHSQHYDISRSYFGSLFEIGKPLQEICKPHGYRITISVRRKGKQVQKFTWLLRIKGIFTGCSRFPALTPGLLGKKCGTWSMTYGLLKW